MLPPYCLMPVAHAHIGKIKKSFNEPINLPGFYKRYAKLEENKILIFDTNEVSCFNHSKNKTLRAIILVHGHIFII
jgi:hypothetical protein